MAYDLNYITRIRTKILEKVNRELDLACRNDNIPDLLEKYCIVLEDTERFPINTRISRVLVIGELSGSKKDYQLAAKKMGINQDNIEFIDYEQSKHLNARKLEYSGEYSDIILGPIPHKISGMGDFDNLIAMIKKEPLNYPRMIISKTNSCDNRLKFSLSTFKDCLQKTFYYESILSNY